MSLRNYDVFCRWYSASGGIHAYDVSGKSDETFTNESRRVQRRYAGDKVTAFETTRRNEPVLKENFATDTQGRKHGGTGPLVAMGNVS